MNSLGVVLEQFPEEVIVYVTSPRTGIQRRMKWPPTLNEIVEACEEHLSYLERLKQAKRVAVERLPPPQRRDLPKGALSSVFVPEAHRRYQSLLEWSKTAHPALWKQEPSSDGRRGIWIPWDVWECSM